MRRHYKSVSGGGILPAGYAECEYIESTGTQYIDTGVIPNSTTDVRIDGMFLNYRASIFGSNPYLVITSSVIGNNSIYARRNNVLMQANSSDGSTRHILEYVGNRFLIDGVVKVTFSVSTFSATYSAMLFARSDSSGGVEENSNSRIYSARIIKDGNLVRNFIPAIRLSDNKPGMYDLCGSICPLTGTPFYINAGSGEFLYKLK